MIQEITPKNPKWKSTNSKRKKESKNKGSKSSGINSSKEVALHQKDVIQDNTPKNPKQKRIEEKIDPKNVIQEPGLKR